MDAAFVSGSHDAAVSSYLRRFIMLAFYVVSIFSGAEARRSPDATTGQMLEEKKALLQFREGCHKKDCDSVFGNWSSKDHCQWSAVACNDKGFVVSLQLQGFDLQSQLQESNNITYKRGVPWGRYLLSLQQLEVLHISGVFFGSAVPPELGSLSHLTTLILSGCGLLGPIPPQLGNLSRLQELDMSQQAGQSLNVVVRGCTNITTCSRDTNAQSLIQADGRNLQDYSSLSSSHSMMRAVGFPNGLPGFNGTAIPPELCNLTRLEYLHLAWNLLGGTIPSCVFRLPLLSVLDLSNNHLTSTQLNDVFCRAPGVPSPLTTLQISHNALSGELPHCLFTNFTGLQGLDLGSNQLSGNLPPSLANFSQLLSLNLSYNEFTGAFRFSSFLLIYEVDVSNNNLTSMEEPPLSLIDSSVTSTLLLGNNQFSGPFPSWIWCVSSLSTLNLSMNGFNGQIVPTSDKCGENQGLQLVDLHGNTLSGKVPWDIFQHCSVLSMSSNHFSGEGLNLSIFNYLTYLDVTNNNLSGGVELGRGPGMNMSLLGLSSNRFSGKLPAVCSERTKVDNNLFSGSIPSEMLICSEFLILHNNRLTGEIPDIERATKLVLLDAAHNMLSGSLSSALFGLPLLRVLILGDNNFSGAIPSWNSSPHQLQVLDLSNNQFTGTIPAQSLHLLEAFCLSSSGGSSGSGSANHSSGTLYNEVVEIEAKGRTLQYTYLLEAVVSLDLSGNFLEGTMPWELGNMVNTIFLNLSGNHLEGVIPDSVGDLLQLESLDLSNNRLSGRIPNSLRQLHFLSMINLSNNQLEGPIPESPQWENSASSFMGNPGLCGPPLNHRPCAINTSASSNVSNVLFRDHEHAADGNGIPWPSVLIGYVLGFAIVLPIAKCLLANLRTALFSLYRISLRTVH